MTTQIGHSGGLIDTFLELGFDQVKYFETTIISTASGFFINPPARRILVENLSEISDVYLRINKGDATPSVSFSPGDNIKIRPKCSFSLDFDSIKEVSLITAPGESAQISGLLGFKGTI